MDLAISIYIEASEEARNRAEEERAIAAKQQSAAVEALTSGLSRLNNGDLTVRLTQDLAPEYKKLQDDFNATAERLDETIAAIAMASSEISNAASETSTSTTDLSQRTEEQAASLEETSAAMEQISETVRRNAGNAQEANQLAGVTRELADRGGQVVAEAIKAISRVEAPHTRFPTLSGSSTRSRGKRTCSRSMPPSKPPAPAKLDAALRSSLPKCAAWRNAPRKRQKTSKI